MKNKDSSDKERNDVPTTRPSLSATSERELPAVVRASALAAYVESGGGPPKEDIQNPALKFSSAINYKIKKHNYARIVDRKLVSNDTNVSQKIPSYQEILPDNTILRTVRCFVERDESVQSISWDVEPVPGSNRQRIIIPKPDDDPPEIKPGTTAIVTELDVAQFCFSFDKKDHIAFCIRHSLPQLPYLQKAVPKQVMVQIEKPSRFFSSWEGIFLHQPSNDYEGCLHSFEEWIQLEFNFNIMPLEHYFNAIFIRRRSRVSAGSIMKHGIKFFQKGVGSA